VILIAVLTLTMQAAGVPAVESVRDRMDRFNRALGVECTHCHVAYLWKDDSTKEFGTAVKMSRMVEVLNATRLRDIGEIACWTCHRGERQPSRLPRPALDAELARWPESLAGASNGQKITMSVYNVSLGVTCEHCHDASDWKRADKREMQTAAKMIAMFEEFPKYMPEGARTQCYMCHKGSKKPPKTVAVIASGSPR